MFSNLFLPFSFHLAISPLPFSYIFCTYFPVSLLSLLPSSSLPPFSIPSRRRRSRASHARSHIWSSFISSALARIVGFISSLLELPRLFSPRSCHSCPHSSSSLACPSLSGFGLNSPSRSPYFFATELMASFDSRLLRASYRHSSVSNTDMNGWAQAVLISGY